MTRFLLITIIIIGTVSLSRSQVVELIGEGVISENTYALEIPNPATVDHVIVEATAIFSEISEAEARNRTVTFSNTTGDNQVAYFQYTELNYGANANLDKYHTGYFSATFNDVGTGKIFLDKMGNGTSVISFTAYVYRIGSSGIYNTIIDDHAYVYHNGSANPVNYNFTIPHSGGYRDIVVKMPFTNLESDQLRWANIKLKAGSKIVSSEFQTNNSGELLRLETLVLTDVPGDVTEITLEIYSRKRISDENDGDSFITGPAVLYTTVGRDCGECEGQITTLELKYLGTETNATHLRLESDLSTPWDNTSKLPDVDSGTGLQILGDRLVYPQYDFQSFNPNSGTTQPDYTTENGTLGLIYGDLFGGRLPYYHRLDIDAKYNLFFGENSKLVFDASIINVYDRQNVFYVDLVTNEVVYQLPIMPSFGMTFYF